MSQVTEAGYDEESLRRLIAERYAELVHLAYSIIHERAEAEDVTQQALERAWRSRGQLNDGGKALFWLRRILVREALRRRSRYRRLLGWPHVGEMDPADRSSNEALRDGRLDLVRAFQRLPADQAGAVVLHHYFQYSIPEVAELMGVPFETVRSRLRLGMRKLREELRDE